MMSGKVQQAKDMQRHKNFHENLSKMRKAAGINVFNDGEVIVQNAPTTSRAPYLSMSEEQEKTEEVTVKVSPIKNIVNATRFTGLGKCSRVVLKASSLDVNSDSDDDKGNDGDVSTFIRPIKKINAIAPRNMRSTTSSTTASVGNGNKTLSESVNSIYPTEASEAHEIKLKNFIMDSEMKNFNPANWRRTRKTQKVADIQCLEKVLNEEHKVKPPNVVLSCVLSPIMDCKTTSHDSIMDHSEEMETCPLDLSICETKYIIPVVASSSSRHHQSQQLPHEHLSYQPASKEEDTCRGNFNSSVPTSQDALIAVRICNSSANIGSNDDIILSSSPPLLLPHTKEFEQERDNDEKSSHRRKRVSFAGNSGPEKRSKEYNSEQPRMMITSKVQEDKAVVLTLKGNNYTRLNVLGKGGSSCVYRVMSQNDFQLYAYKRVDVKGSTEDNEAVFDSYINEIELLKRLQGSSPYIIDLIDAEVNREEMYIAIVMEAGDVDLAKVLSQKQQQAATAHPVPSSHPLEQHHHKPLSSSASSSSSHLLTTAAAASTMRTAYPETESSIQLEERENDCKNKELLNPFFTRLVWQEMLEAVDHIHRHRIVHGDLKPANFVFVKGHLKLIDFGIAKAFSNDTTNIYRESQIGTVNYMAPEAIAPYSTEDGDGNGIRDSHEGMSMRLGRASDIWSLGCILYQMVYGRPPFAALTTIQKLHAIPNPKYVIQYPKDTVEGNGQGQGYSVDWDAIETIKACLHRDPRKRAVIRGEGGLLSMSYLSIKSMNSRFTNIPNQFESMRGIQADHNQISVTKDEVRCAVIQAIQKIKKQGLGQGLGQEQDQKIGENELPEDQLVNHMWQLLNDEQESQSIAVDCIIQKDRTKSSAIADIMLSPKINIHSVKTNKTRQEEEEKLILLGNIHETKKQVRISHIKSGKDKNLEVPSVTISLPEDFTTTLIEKETLIGREKIKDIEKDKETKKEPEIERENDKDREKDKKKEVKEKEMNKENDLKIIIAPSQSTRLSLLKAAAEAAKKRSNAVEFLITAPAAGVTAPTMTAAAVCGTTNRTDRQPLSNLHSNYNTQNTVDQHSIEKVSMSKSGQRDRRIHSKVLSPDKQDNRLVIEKRIGAMRKFLDEEQDLSVTGTRTLDLIDENSFF